MMQLEFSPEVEHMLESEAMASGCTSADYITKLVSAHIKVTRSAATLSSSQIKDAEEAKAWILSRNPHLLQNAPEDFDWQRLKEEGRRY
jgi:hypothetical protein